MIGYHCSTCLLGTIYYYLLLFITCSLPVKYPLYYLFITYLYIPAGGASSGEEYPRVEGSDGRAEEETRRQEGQADEGSSSCYLIVIFSNC